MIDMVGESPRAVADDLARVLADPRRATANTTAVARMFAAGAQLIDVQPARDVLGLRPRNFLHAGPPIEWERASGPLRGALIGAALFEGLDTDPAAAEARFASALTITLDPGHHHSTVGPMAGVVSASMWMFVLEDPTSGRRAYCSLNEGMGQVLRYGAYGPEVIDRLHWMSDVLGPLLRDAVRAHGPIDIKAILAKIVQMGDEAHNRNRVGTLILMRDLVPAMIESGPTRAEIAAAVRFMGGNDHFFLNLAMPAGKLALDAARGIPGSTMVVAMARNGTDFGMQVSGTGSDWFTGPAEVPSGLFSDGFGPADGIDVTEVVRTAILPPASVFSAAIAGLAALAPPNTTNSV
jgi:hypothetical protein